MPESIDELAPGLVSQLRRLHDDYGPAGVTEASEIVAAADQRARMAAAGGALGYAERRSNVCGFCSTPISQATLGNPEEAWVHEHDGLRSCDGRVGQTAGPRIATPANMSGPG